MGGEKTNRINLFREKNPSYIPKLIIWEITHVPTHDNGVHSRPIERRS